MLLTSKPLSAIFGLPFATEPRVAREDDRDDVVTELTDPERGLALSSMFGDWRDSELVISCATTRLSSDSW
jgi:hypothetical protein